MCSKDILNFVTNFIPFNISPLWKSAKSSALVTTFIQGAKIESRIVIYDIRIFSTKINMTKLLENKQRSGVQSSLFQGQTGMILNILYFVTNFIPFTISPLWKSAKSSALVTTFLQVAKIESRIVIYDIRIFSTKINMM